MKKKIVFIGIIDFISSLSASAVSIEEKPLIDLFKKDYP